MNLIIKTTRFTVKLRRSSIQDGGNDGGEGAATFITGRSMRLDSPSFRELAYIPIMESQEREVIAHKNHLLGAMRGEYQRDRVGLTKWTEFFCTYSPGLSQPDPNR